MPIVLFVFNIFWIIFLFWWRYSAPHRLHIAAWISVIISTLWLICVAREIDEKNQYISELEDKLEDKTKDNYTDYDEY